MAKSSLRGLSSIRTVAPVSTPATVDIPASDRMLRCANIQIILILTAQYTVKNSELLADEINVRVAAPTGSFNDFFP